MPNPLQIISGKQPDKILNKEQKRFNSLVDKITTLRKKIDLVTELDLELRRIGTERITPSEDKMNMAQREWVIALHHHPGQQKLSKKLAEKLSRVMLEEIGVVINTDRFKLDVELQEMYAFYEGSGRRFEEIQAENEEEEKIMAAQMMHMMFGIDVDPEDLGNPQKMKEIFSAKEADFVAAEQQQFEQQRSHKKSNAAKAAAEKRQAIQSSVKKTVKQIYLELVRYFHPDKEQDDQKRAEKTEIMKQITAAFEAEDHLRLVELQMNLLTSDDNVLADFDNAQLKYFNQTLRQQANELEQELFFTSPEGNGNQYAVLYSLDRTQMLRNIERYIQSNNKEEKNIRRNLGLIRDVAIFKDYIQTYEFSEGWDW